MTKLKIVITLLVILMVGCASRTIQSEPAVSANCQQCSSDNNILSASCLIYIYGENNSVYISRQNHQFCLCNGSMIVDSQEPNGVFEAVISGDGELSVIQSIKDPKLQEIYKEFGAIINAAVNANISGKINSSGKPINLYGQWYTQLYNADNGDFEYYSVDNKITLVQNVRQTARLFNFGKLLGSDMLIPLTIEVYGKKDRNLLGEKKIKINYYMFEKK